VREAKIHGHDTEQFYQRQPRHNDFTAIGDNADGKGCYAVGVQPGNSDADTTNTNTTNDPANAQQGSLFVLLLASNVPLYVPNDL